jgi:death-on-curing protein
VTDWVWIEPEVVEAVHDRQLAEHGGPAGVRNSDGLASALARPQNLAAYEQPDAAALAAAYAVGIARNHPFVDGNKRTAWILCRLFLVLNDVELAYAEQEAIDVMLRLGSGEISEEDLAGWLRERTPAA